MVDRVSHSKCSSDREGVVNRDVIDTYRFEVAGDHRKYEMAAMQAAPMTRPAVPMTAASTLCGSRPDT